MKKILGTIIVSILMICALSECTGDFLNVAPKGLLTEENLKDSINGFVIAAYSYPPKAYFTYTLNPCYYGCVRSDDSYKGGGGGLNDQIGWYQMELFSIATVNINNFDYTWQGGYIGIRRCNVALQQLHKVSIDDFPEKEQRIAEMRFVRGYFYFMMKQAYKWMPYIDEYLDENEYENQTNHPEGMTDLDLWQLVLDDFEAAYNVLPVTQQDVGRPTKYAAEAFMVKTLMWMAYELDNNHQLVNVNEDRLREALEHCNNIISSGKYDLCSDYADMFLCENDNSTPESIFEWQCSVDEGSTGWSVNVGERLNTPTWMPYYSCCDFHKMSFDYVNATRTGIDGLPLFDTYNDAELKNNPAYFNSNTFDPRLCHTAGIPGLPWCYRTDILFDSVATVYPQYFGYIHSMKEQVDPSSICQYKTRGNSKNVKVIRYSEILLWKAEILIRLGREDEALPIINQIRQRAANSTGRLKFADDTPVLDFNIQPYVDGVNCAWTNDFAWKAYMWESRLEFAGEGRRFFDLVRWNIAAEVMNAHFTREKQRLSWMEPGFFTAGRDEFLPIPQGQINWSRGNFIQNTGY